MIITITGKNTFAAWRRFTQLKQEFTEQHGDSGLVELEASEVLFKDVQQAMMSQGLFSGQTLVVLRGLGGNKTLHEDIIENVDALPDETTLIIYEPQFDMRTKAAKALKTHTTFEEFAPLDEHAMGKWIVDEFSEMGGSISRGDADFLASRVNYDQQAIYHELEKLLNLEHVDRGAITETVEESFNDSIFNLVDAAFSGDSTKSLGLYRSMLDNKVEAHYIFSMLIWQLHILAVVSSAGSRSPDQIAKDHKLSPYVVRKSAGLASKIGGDRVKKILADAAEIDRKSKSIGQYDMNVAVDAFIASL